MADLVVDTDVVSYGFRFDPSFQTFYGPAIQGHRAIVSFMTVAELEFGVLNRQWGDKRRDTLRQYLATNYIQYGVTNRVCQQWAELVYEAKSQGRVLKTADAWIAATAVALGVPLVTNNVSDFEYLSAVTLISLRKA